MKIFVVGVEDSNYGEGSLFLNSEGEVLGFVDGNDATWRHEYFDGILHKVSLTVIQKSMHENKDFEEYIRSKLKTHFGF